MKFNVEIKAVVLSKNPLPKWENNKQTDEIIGTELRLMVTDGLEFSQYEQDIIKVRWVGIMVDQLSKWEKGKEYNFSLVGNYWRTKNGSGLSWSVKGDE